MVENEDGRYPQASFILTSPFQAIYVLIKNKFSYNFMKFRVAILLAVVSRESNAGCKSQRCRQCYLYISSIPS